MTNLTKDEVRKLAPEQQAAIARMELERLRMRRELIERARGHRGIGMSIVEGLLIALPGGLAILSTAIPHLLPFAIIAVSWVVGFYVVGFNRRLDALMQLLDHDINKGAPEAKEADAHDA